ncbi:MAG: hypothetical protein ACT4N9_09000 [Paracoccaceae bacterium]
MFKHAQGQRYSRFLDQLHASTLFDWYLEVGCRTGRTFAGVRSKTIAVDPYFLAETNIIGKKPALHVFQTTSDEFFASGVLDKLGIKLSFSFLDGMHLFEFLLRDFINTEANSRPEGVIALHDCCPFSVKMTTRDLNNLPAGPWTGDVWKLIPILQTWRPELTLTILDCKPTGLVMVTGLDPKNTALKDNYDEIVRTFVDADIATWGLERFATSFEFTESRAMAEGGFAPFAAVRLPETEALSPVLITP